MRIFYSLLFILSLTFILSLKGYSQKKAAINTGMGAVIDELTKLPVEGASVNFCSGKQLTATNEQGRFSVKLTIQNGDTLLVSAIGSS
jgi:uncharacterized protein YegP (UPF0339 family)